MRWRHVMVSTHNSWLPGDERGFRNRRHRIHSSGDYRNPPPKSEHRGLREYNQRRAKRAVVILRHLREAVGFAFIERLRKEGHRVLVIAVGGKHVHALVELPDHRPTIRSIIGRCKRLACEAVKRELTGHVWAAGGEFKPVDTYGHQRSAYKYIRDDQGPGAWVWTFRDGVKQNPTWTKSTVRRVTNPTCTPARQSGPSLRSEPGVGREKRWRLSTHAGF